MSLPKWTLEIDDESLVDWRTINNSFLLNSKSRLASWSAEDYRVGILIQMGVYALIESHKGDHSAMELRHVHLRANNGSDLFITRSHFEDLGLWVNIMPGGGSASKFKRLLEVNPDSYEALFGVDGKHAPHKARFTPYGGGITIWPEAAPEGAEGNWRYCNIGIYAGADTPHHAWYRFEFEMERPEVTFLTRRGLVLPDKFRSDKLKKTPVLAPPERKKGTEWPSLLVEAYGIPPGGDGTDPPPLP